MYHFPEDTTCAVLLRETVSVTYQNLIKIISHFGAKRHFVWRKLISRVPVFGAGGFISHL
jgi:hypothetical protein